jgi:hypothetical protein
VRGDREPVCDPRAGLQSERLSPRFGRLSCRLSCSAKLSDSLSLGGDQLINSRLVHVLSFQDVSNIPLTVQDAHDG